ncbi:hypothetical protein OPV22_031575 [Ensete ventricosum]|uniref:Protein ABIL1 n=1 Tax=Ensete ventricosum TaxID=4639 RepID=A0AAV8PJE6_ENSVE|nr:hypothetical protein OPV22_031575 [Ensete ventricosum]
MTFDEVSMERSKSFVKSLQELKNLRPQLYSAAEYCEKSYLHSEQKQMVLDNLKSYAVRAIVNTVDHLGTVAYKLTDLFEQQVLDASTMEMKISCLNQQNFTCQAYGDKDGLSQHQTPARTLRHHKHYILPSKYASNMLSWHLASEANSAATGDPLAAPCTRGVKSYKVNSEVFHLLVAEDPAGSLPLSAPLRATSGNVTFGMIPNKSALTGSLESRKPISAIKSFNSPGRCEICRPPAHTLISVSVKQTVLELPMSTSFDD